MLLSYLAMLLRVTCAACCLENTNECSMSLEERIKLVSSQRTSRIDRHTAPLQPGAAAIGFFQRLLTISRPDLLVRAHKYTVKTSSLTGLIWCMAEQRPPSLHLTAGLTKPAHAAYGGDTEPVAEVNRANAVRCRPAISNASSDPHAASTTRTPSSRSPLFQLCERACFLRQADSGTLVECHRGGLQMQSTQCGWGDVIR